MSNSFAISLYYVAFRWGSASVQIHRPAPSGCARSSSTFLYNSDPNNRLHRRRNTAHVPLQSVTERGTGIGFDSRERMNTINSYQAGSVEDSVNRHPSNFNRSGNFGWPPIGLEQRDDFLTLCPGSGQTSLIFTFRLRVCPQMAGETGSRQRGP